MFGFSDFPMAELCRFREPPAVFRIAKLVKPCVEIRVRLRARRLILIATLVGRAAIQNFEVV